MMAFSSLEVVRTGLFEFCNVLFNCALRSEKDCSIVVLRAEGADCCSKLL